MMKLWMSGEIEAPVGDDFRLARSSVEKAINDVIEHRSYDLPLEGWDCIMILRDDGNFSEITRYSKKKRDMDFRLRINYEAFKNGSQLDREKLIYEMLLRSLGILRDKGLHATGLDKLKADVESVASARGWI